MNQVILRGNLTRDPELRTIESGNRSISVINFTVAVSREYTKSSGVKDKIVSYIPCEAWDSGAELIADSFRKGDLVFVEGSMRNDKWEKDGVKRSKPVFNAYQVQLLSANDGGSKMIDRHEGVPF